MKEIFFGKEDEPDARFVVLDCQHVMEVEGLDKWMDSDISGTISSKTCPKCCTPVRWTHRYRTIIKTVQLDIEEVKVCIVGCSVRGFSQVKVVHEMS